MGTPLPVSNSRTVTLRPVAVHRDTYGLKRLLYGDSGVTFFAARDQQRRGIVSVKATFLNGKQIVPANERFISLEDVKILDKSLNFLENDVGYLLNTSLEYME